MMNLALKMLIGNRASCIGVIFGIFLATLLISQQSAIFLGLVSRSYRIVTDIPAPNIWDSFEINNRRAVIVGICKITQGFYPQPIIYTTRSQFSYFTSMPKDQVEFIAAKTRPNVSIRKVLDNINSHAGLNGLTSDEM